MTRPTSTSMPLDLRYEYEKSGFIPAEWTALGYHWCPDWDFLLIGPGDIEMQACRCGFTDQSGR